MRILLDNIDLGLTNGASSFARQLTNELINQKHDVINTIELIKLEKVKHQQLQQPEIQLSFVEAQVKFDSVVPMVQRLGSIHYNSDDAYGDWWLQNQYIQRTYSDASGVIFQSHFTRRLVETFFGEKEDSIVINNGVNYELINSISPFDEPILDAFETIWLSASSWRPNKRLSENVNYFLEHAGENEALVVVGASIGPYHDHPRILYVGELNWRTLVSLYKRAKYFIHLAYHDHCPNVVIEARAAGCHIICASCSGTPEIAGVDATVIQEDDWEPQPTTLYMPPKLDFTRKSVNSVDSNVNITDVASRYVNYFKSIKAK